MKRNLILAIMLFIVGFSQAGELTFENCDDDSLYFSYLSYDYALMPSGSTAVGVLVYRIVFPENTEKIEVIRSFARIKGVHPMLKSTSTRRYIGPFQDERIFNGNILTDTAKNVLNSTEFQVKCWTADSIIYVSDVISVDSLINPIDLEILNGDKTTSVSRIDSEEIIEVSDGAINFSVHEDALIRLYNLYGQCVYERRVSSPVSISTEDFPCRFVIANVLANSYSKTIKVMLK